MNAEDTSTPRRLFKKAQKHLESDTVSARDMANPKSVIRAILKAESATNPFHAQLLRASAFQGCHPQINEDVFFLGRYLVDDVKAFPVGSANVRKESSAAGTNRSSHFETLISSPSFTGCGAQIRDNVFTLDAYVSDVVKLNESVVTVTRLVSPNIIAKQLGDQNGEAIRAVYKTNIQLVEMRQPGSGHCNGLLLIVNVMITLGILSTVLLVLLIIIFKKLRLEAKLLYF